MKHGQKNIKLQLTFSENPPNTKWWSCLAVRNRVWVPRKKYLKLLLPFEHRSPNM